MGYLQDFALAVSSLETNLDRFFAIASGPVQEDIRQDLENMTTALASLTQNTDEETQPALAELEQINQGLGTDVLVLLGWRSNDLTSRQINEKMISVFSQMDRAKQLHRELSVQTVSQLQAIALGQENLTSAVMAQFLVLGLLASLIVVIASLVVNRSIATTLASLARTATQIAGGDLNAQAPLIVRSDEVGQLAVAFSSMTAQLREVIGSLEQRVADRTRRLEIAAALSEQLTAVLKLDELLAEVVNQIKDSFNYYHAQIYLLDDKRARLVLAEGTGQAGVEMKAKGHNISLEAPTSLVARAARTGEIVRVDNVRLAADWLSNPLLPQTWSEMAVPIILEGQAVGVLDVQEDKIAGLDENDANLLRSLANQVAVAIRNARLFQQVETALAEAYRSQERYIQQSWEKFRGQAMGSQYLYVQPGAALPDEAGRQTLVEIQQQALSQTRPAVVPIKEGPVAKQAVVVPINLRGQTIGALQLHLPGEKQQWTDNDMAVIETVIDQFAQIAENLRLFEETRERASREQAIREVTEKLRAAPTLDNLLTIASRELGRWLAVPYTVIELGIEAEKNGRLK
ncbi:MAG: GAF domain-containing protein [Chloroflexota bacterium]